MIENIQHLKETERIFNLAILDKYKSVVSKTNETILLNMNELKKLDPIESYLHEFLNPYGFSHSQIIDMVSAFDSSAGKQFISPTHRLIKDRENLILEEIVAKSGKVFNIEENIEKLDFPISLQIEKTIVNEGFKIEKNSSIGQFDLEKITFPLTIRKWQKGDYFMPLGMKNLKKVSDFFIDQKLSLSEKENTWILECGNKIVWIIGLRPDERFKITPQTKHILKIHLR